jgi:hypothetical protein
VVGTPHSDGVPASIDRKTREALQRKASHGYVTGGRVFGYDNVRVDGHTERRINKAEAAVVRKVYDLYAAGLGLPTIAHRLNAELLPAPRAQQDRKAGWCPSSLHSVLRRSLYRGELVHGQRRNLGTDPDGRPLHGMWPESEWCACRCRTCASCRRTWPRRWTRAVHRSSSARCARTTAS